MMRVKLASPYDFKIPGKRVVVAYSPGEYTVKREWGEAMVKAGVAKEVKPPNAD